MNENFKRDHKPFGLEWRTINWMIFGPEHIIGAYYSYLLLTGEVPWSTVWFELLYGYIGGLGITVGCHRYWTHKTFKAKLPLQIILMIMQTIAFQYPIWRWCHNHRIHHMYSDTNSDPHNSKRGFWFCHMGWLFLPEHPDYKNKLETFDMPDLAKDPVVRFQSRWYWTLTAISRLVPILVFRYFWGLPYLVCIAADCRRHLVSNHVTFTVNSFAHIFGNKPYNKNSTSVENPLVSVFAIGEGFHNYHHTFPWDYKASEFGWKFNVSTLFIDFMAWIGWAYDLKTVSPELVMKRACRTGDGSHPKCHDQFNCDDINNKGPTLPVEQKKDAITGQFEREIWGWDDENVTNEYREMTRILKVN